MRILYSVPDIGLNDFNGGSAHVTGVLESMIMGQHEVSIICNSGKTDKAKLIKIRKFKYGLFRTINYFISPFFITLYSCLTNKPDIVYERARIFGGGAILAGRIFGVKSIYGCGSRS